MRALAGLLALFVAFLAVVGAVHGLNRLGAGRFGYAPLALPNAALMLVPHGLLLALLSGLSQGVGPLTVFAEAGPTAWVLLGVGAAVVLGMAVLIGMRTRPWIGAAATLLMLAAAPVVIATVLFGRVAGAEGDG